MSTTGFILKTGGGTIIRFNYYLNEAPVTVKAFDALLPFTRPFFQARVSGQEIWTDNAPVLDIIQVYGPLKPARAKTANCIGLYYGEGKGLDCCNIFAKVFDEDMHLLKILGEDIWKHGAQEVTFDEPD